MINYAFYVNAVGKEVINQFVDETGAWLKLSDGMLLQLHDNEIKTGD